MEADSPQPPVDSKGRVEDLAKEREQERQRLAEREKQRTTYGSSGTAPRWAGYGSGWRLSFGSSNERRGDEAVDDSPNQSRPSSPTPAASQVDEEKDELDSGSEGDQKPGGPVRRRSTRKAKKEPTEDEPPAKKRKCEHEFAACQEITPLTDCAQLSPPRPLHLPLPLLLRPLPSPAHVPAMADATVRVGKQGARDARRTTIHSPPKSNRARALTASHRQIDPVGPVQARRLASCWAREPCLAPVSTSSTADLARLLPSAKTPNPLVPNTHQRPTSFHKPTIKVGSQRRQWG